MALNALHEPADLVELPESDGRLSLGEEPSRLDVDARRATELFCAYIALRDPRRRERSTVALRATVEKRTGLYGVGVNAQPRV